MKRTGGWGDPATGHNEIFVLIRKPVDKYTTVFKVTAGMLLNIEVLPVILLLEIPSILGYGNVHLYNDTGSGHSLLTHLRIYNAGIFLGTKAITICVCAISH